MASGYMPANFFRLCDLELLAQRLNSYTSADDGDPPPDLAAKTHLDIQARYDRLTPTQRAQADADFRAVHELACETGVQLLFEEATAAGEDLAGIFAELLGHHNRALWMLITHFPLFERCYRFHKADTFTEKTWERIQDPTLCVPVSMDDATRAWLTMDLQSYFQHHEGRGRSCEVQWDRRGDRTYCFVYVENYGTNDPEFAESGLHRPARRPAFLVVFVHSENAGTLHMHFSGRKATRQKLVRQFGLIALGVPLQLGLDRRHAYQLDLLKSRAFRFRYDPSWGIQRIWVKWLRLSARRGNRRSVTLMANTKNRPEAVYDLMDELFASGAENATAADSNPKPLLFLYEVNQAEIGVEFETGTGLKRDPFRLTYPNHCNLGHEGIDRHLRDMLERSGLAPAPLRPSWSADDDAN